VSCAPAHATLPAATVGLLGGAFDPPHNGHVTVAREALTQLALSRLLLVVTGSAPHKEIGTDSAVRYRLAELAFADLENAEVSRIELERSGPSYTLETVRWARERYGETTFIVGADEFASFLDWYEPDGVLEAAHLAVATRPGFPRETLEPVLAGLRRADRVHFFSIPEMPISSREIRELVAAGEDVSELVPALVAAELRERRLYCDETTPEQVISEGMTPTCEGS